MRRKSYEPLFSVLVPNARKDVFFLNMRVYEVVQSVSDSEGQDGEPVSVIWCAVYKEAQPEPLGQDGVPPSL